RDAAERLRQRLFGMGDRRQHDIDDEGRIRLYRWALVDQFGRTQDLLGGDLARLGGKLVAAAGTADPLENPVAHQRLQHRLEVAWRQPVTDSERLRRDRALP